MSAAYVKIYRVNNNERVFKTEAILTLPMTAIALDNDEMKYVDGDVSISKLSNGYLIRLSSGECGDISALIAGGTPVVSAIASVIPVSGPAIAAGLAAGFGLWGAYLWLCSNHNGMYILANKKYIPFAFIITQKQVICIKKNIPFFIYSFLMCILLILPSILKRLPISPFAFDLYCFSMMIIEIISLIVLAVWLIKNGGN